ncbi:hypothetical protein [Flavobacterium sp. I3-2]|uniref:hypothetical protein n=1 Tax=Flavobacterium sp. I3-2 TaxID=2748319 RepID=UPI0015B322F8|nr:hypothetical protein [Flavobacterium sp. I3-2]
MGKKYILFLFMFFTFLLGKAQNIIVSPGDMPISVIACDDPATFSFRVSGPLNSGSQISITLPEGSKYLNLLTTGVTETITPTGATLKFNFCSGSRCRISSKL